MNATVRVFYIPVLFTTFGLFGVACAHRTEHVVANPLSTSTYNEPRSNAYDTEAWARSMAEKDRARAVKITQLKAELHRASHINFFPDQDKLFRERFFESAWNEADRRMIRGYLSEILILTRLRRAFEDEPAFEIDETQALRILNAFTAYDKLPGVM